MISLCAWASIYWSFSCIPYGASQSPSPIQEESGGRKQTEKRGRKHHIQSLTLRGDTVLSSYKNIELGSAQNAL